MSYGPGGQPPHGSGGWGAPPPPPPGGPYGPPPPPPPPPGGGGRGPQVNQGSAIGALIANIFGLFFCFCSLFSLLLAIPGLICAIIGTATMNSNAQTSRGCTMAAWVLFGLSAALSILMFILSMFLWGSGV
ncbi:MAG: hypothetical protein M0026_02025 [Nocardiopsaceae bacterium]|nr:hypothetical protein [Nocardiopsaceae bacterium]